MMLFTVHCISLPDLVVGWPKVTPGPAHDAGGGPAARGPPNAGEVQAARRLPAARAQSKAGRRPPAVARGGRHRGAAVQGAAATAPAGSLK